MSNLKIIKLYFTSPLHVGEAGIGLEESTSILHSDTIFNAMCNSLAKLYGTEWVTDFLNNYEKNPSFKISSAFPFKKDTLLFPKPICKANVSKQLLQDYSKKLKKATYLTKDIFEKWISYQSLSENDLEEATKNRVSKIYENMTLPKVSISSSNLESNIFYVGSVRFKEDSGLWFLVDFDKDDVYNDIVKPALRLLQHDGIGGKRTWGYGSFVLEEDTVNINFPEPNAYMLFSLFYPGSDEKTLFSSGLSRWDFITRGGYALPYGAKKPNQKPQMTLISEGSIFENKPEGKLMEFGSDFENIKSLYHYGIAYNLPVFIGED